MICTVMDRLKLIRGKDSFILESVFAKTVFETLSLPFSKPNEIAVYQYLQETLDREINKLVGASKTTGSVGVRKEVEVALAELRRQVYILMCVQLVVDIQTFLCL